MKCRNTFNKTINTKKKLVEYLHYLGMDRAL